MNKEALSSLVDRLEHISTVIGECLHDRLGEQVGTSLLHAGVLPTAMAGYFQDRSTPVERKIDTLTSLSLFNDCLCMTVMPCLRSKEGVAWERLQGLHPLLSRMAGFYATVHGRYQTFKTLPSDRVVDFFNIYCADTAWFGFSSNTTRFLGVKLCAYTAAKAGHPALRNEYVDDILSNLWKHVVTRAGIDKDAVNSSWSHVKKYMASIDVRLN